MRSMMAVALVLAMMEQAAADECPLTQSVYGQTGSAWSLRFMPVPRDGAANQIGAFEIIMPGAFETVFDGAIYIPNGFGQPWGMVTLDEAKSDAEDAETEEESSPAFWEGTVYALVDGSITEFPWDPDQPRDAQAPPQQILLPQFASHVWYSMLRGDAFAGDNTVLDTFVLKGCTV